jgi:hypothetical protein
MVIWCPFLAITKNEWAKNMHSTNMTLHKTLIVALLLGSLLAGCTVVGPSAIRSGRLAYNEAITETNNQQILKLVIQSRYEETGSLLSVASVTANVRVTSSAGIQAGFGDRSDYDGNLVPFSGGFIYEENPTISYTPVAGATYMRQIMSPIPLAGLAQILGGLNDAHLSFLILVRSVNGIYNPDFLFTDEQDDPRFDRFVDIMSGLTRAHRLHWAEDPRKKGAFSLSIDQAKPEYAAQVREMRELTGIPAEQGGPSTRTIIPVSLAWNDAAAGGLGITTRSVLDLMEILAGAVDVPQEDLATGLAKDYPPPGRVGRQLRVHYADSKPEEAYVSVEFNNGWFYIDRRDLLTKRYFRLMNSLWSSTIADATAKSSAAPVLTVPVSR